MQLSLNLFRTALRDSRPFPGVNRDHASKSDPKMGPQSGRRLLPSENVSVSASLLSFPLQEPENLSGAAPGWHGRLCGGGGGGHIAGPLL